MSYRNKPDNRTHPVLKESNLSRERALCENDRAKRSVRNAERRVALPPNVYRIEGIEPAGIRNNEGVRRERDTSSRGPQMSHEVERKAKDGAPLGPFVIVTRLLSNFLQLSSPRIHRDRAIRDWRGRVSGRVRGQITQMLTLLTLPTPAKVKYHWRSHVIHAAPKYLTIKYSPKSTAEPI